MKKNKEISVELKDFVYDLRKDIEDLQLKDKETLTLILYMFYCALFFTGMVVMYAMSSCLKVIPK
jgi:hypothetical protein